MTNDHDGDARPYVAPFIRRMMPDASEEEILEANTNVREYVLLLYGIYERLKAEGKVDEMLQQTR